MGLLIQGIRLDQILITREKDEMKFTGNYSLMSENDTVLAKQGFNGYSEIKLVESSDTVALRNKLIESIKTDLENTLGFTGGK